MPRSDVLAIGHVLRGVRYPAYRWQLIAQADLFGVDGVSRERLYGLPVRRYPNWESVVSELTAEPRPGDATRPTVPRRDPRWLVRHGEPMRSGPAGAFGARHRSVGRGVR